MTELDFTSIMATKRLTKQELNKKVFNIDSELTGSFRPALDIFKDSMKNFEIVNSGYQEFLLII